MLRAHDEPSLVTSRFGHSPDAHSAIDTRSRLLIEIFQNVGTNLIPATSTRCFVASWTVARPTF